jgi:hypothetical protein
MSPRESTESRRSAILALAAGRMDRARSRRIRVARIATTAAVVALGAAVAAVLPRAAHQPAAPRALAIDFRWVATVPESVDFSIVRESGVPILDTLTDDEAEAALEEAGYCVRLLRMDAKTQLVDCSSGMPAVIR